MMYYRRYMTRKSLKGRKTHRKMLTDDLRKKLASDSLKLLTLSSSDREAIKGASDFQKRKVEEQGRYMLKILEAIDRHDELKMNSTLEECCDKACDEALSKCSGRTASSWFRTCELNNTLFHQVTKYLNPF